LRQAEQQVSYKNLQGKNMQQKKASHLMKKQEEYGKDGQEEQDWDFKKYHLCFKTN
jgi:hypothetical protein